jgi:hypothetical protein
VYRNMHNPHKQYTQIPLTEVKEIAFKNENMRAFHIDIEKVC